MRPIDDIEKRLQEMPLPRLKDGPHRETLKQSLLADTYKEPIMNEKASSPPPATANAPKPRRFAARWVAALAGVAAVALVAIGGQSVFLSLS